MSRENISDEDVYRFILVQIDSVGHLEALLLLWKNRPVQMSVEQLSARLFIDDASVRTIARDLRRRELVSSGEGDSPLFWYEAKSEESDDLMDALASTYRRELVAVSTLIHSKSSSAARDFARAFRFTKDKE